MKRIILRGGLVEYHTPYRELYAVFLFPHARCAECRTGFENGGDNKKREYPSYRKMFIKHRIINYLFSSEIFKFSHLFLKSSRILAISLYLRKIVDTTNNSSTATIILNIDVNELIH